MIGGSRAGPKAEAFLEEFGPEGLLEEDLLGLLGFEDARDGLLQALRHLPLGVVSPASVLDQSRQSEWRACLILGADDDPPPVAPPPDTELRTRLSGAGS